MRSPGYMRTVALFGLASMFCTAAFAQDAPPPAAPQASTPTSETTTAKGPVAVVDEETHDFGEVWVNNQIQHAFTITNKGDAPLQITKVKPSCGCTAAGKHPNTLAPGESGKFPFSLNTARISGKFTKSIVITTNDPKNQQMRLMLTGKVKHHVDIEPKIAQFGRVQEDSVLTRKITLTNNTETPLTVSINKSESLGCFSADIQETNPGQTFEITVTAQPPYKDGINRATLKIETNNDKQKTLEVICMATLPQRLEIRPDRIQLAPQSKSPTTRRVTLTNNGQELITVKSAKATDDKITVETKEIEAGKRYEFAVQVPADYEPPTPDTAVVVTTDDAKSPELRIPIRSITRRPPAPTQQQRPAMELLGKPAPEHKAALQGGGEEQVGGKGDKVQFVTFYASWCGFCKRALPKIEEMYGKYKDNKNVEFIAINLDDRTGRRARTEEQTLQHYKELNLSMPLILDSEKAIGKDYKVTSFPTMFVVGKSGEVEAVHVGAGAGFENAVATEIDLLLAGKTRADFPATPAAQAPPRRIQEAMPAGVKPITPQGNVVPATVSKGSSEPAKPAAAKSAPQTKSDGN